MVLKLLKTTHSIFIYLSKNNWIFAVLFVSSAMFRAASEIVKWRPHYSWFPEWVFNTQGTLNFDFYHISNALHLWLLVIAFSGLIYRCRNEYRNILKLLPLYILVYGLLNDFFYHLFFMKPQYIDLENSFIGELVLIIIGIF